jgi:hypothetical protein
MILSEYMSKERIPLTSQPGWSAKQQLMLDAHNYDSLKEFLDDGGQPDEEQEAVWEELQEKMKDYTWLAKEVARS